MPYIDILLVNVGGVRKRVYQDLSRDFSAIDTPFWAALTAGYLRNCGFLVDLLDANAENLDLAETVARIREISPRHVAIICYSQQANVSTPIMVAVGELCRAIRQQMPRQHLIVTGWHPSALPERTLREMSCDVVVQGEGFYSLKGLLADKKYEDIPGLWWREEDEVVHTERAQNVADLTSELPDVAWDLLPMGRYRAFNWMCLGDFSERNKFASLFTSLGCPFKCKFCAIHATYGEHRLRCWSPEWALRQISILVEEYDVKHINLHDELFVFDARHYLPIAEGIIAAGYNLNINAFARVDVLAKIPEKHLALLKQAGFNWFKLGIETGNSNIRSRVGKGGYSLETVRRAVAKTYEAGIDLCANFMFGLPDDDFETMQETLNLAFDLLPSFPSFFCTMAIPGSELYRDALRNNIPLPDTWLGYASQGYEFQPLPTRFLTARQVLEFRDYAFDAYFKNPRLLHRIERKYGSEARQHIVEMTRIRLRRKLLGD